MRLKEHFINPAMEKSFEIDVQQLRIANDESLFMQANDPFTYMQSNASVTFLTCEEQK